MMKKLFTFFLIISVILMSLASASAKSVMTIGDWTVEKTDNNDFSIVSCSSDKSQISVIKEIGDLDVTAIGEYAFAGSKTIQTLTAFAPLKEIGAYAFQNAAKLYEVSLPNTVKRIGAFAFAGTSALQTINLEDTSIGVIPAYAFMSSGLQNIVLPKYCTQIANNAFLNCRALKTIYIPETVTKIGEKTFDGCENLTILCSKNSYAEKFAKSHNLDSKSAVLCGDADKDGLITIMDATVIQRVIVNVPVTSFDLDAGDVDGEGLDITDATQIQRYLVSVPIPNPVGEITTI